MEAYQAYYNTNEAAQNNATQVLQSSNKTAAVTDIMPYPRTEIVTPQAQQEVAKTEEVIDEPNESNNEKQQTSTDKKAAEQQDSGNANPKKESDPKIINNIVHIDQKGANINITNVTNHQTFVIYANR